MADFKELEGKVIKSITFNDSFHDRITNIHITKPDEVVFTLVDGTVYKMCHMQSCCESVYLEDLVGDVADLVNTPILVAAVLDNKEAPDLVTQLHEAESSEWTFYELRTILGTVQFRWFGTSNGCYSTDAGFYKVTSEGYLA